MNSRRLRRLDISQSHSLWLARISRLIAKALLASRSCGLWAKVRRTSGRLARRGGGAEDVGTQVVAGDRARGGGFDRDAPPSWNRTLSVEPLVYDDLVRAYCIGESGLAFEFGDCCFDR